MGKLIVIIGDNGSGKSRYAEDLSVNMGGELIYLATMDKEDGYNDERIDKHKKMREGKGFKTIEKTKDIAQLDGLEGKSVLLEDVSNLVANEMFENNIDSGRVINKVLGDIEAVREQSECLVAVTIGGIKEDDYNGETKEYVKALNEVNQRLISGSDMTVNMEAGLPYIVKGSGK